MNNTFSFERFLKVLRYDFKMRVPAFGVMFLVLLITPHVLHQIMDFGNSFPARQRLDLYSVMSIFVTFFAPFKIYSAFRDKQGRTSFLMLPASSLEKFAGMVLTSLAMLPAFVLCTFLLDALFCLLFSGQYGSVVTVDCGFLAKGALGLFCIAGAAILGNTLFKKGAPGKTLLCILILMFLWLTVITGYIFENLFEYGDADAEAMQMRIEMKVNISIILYSAVAILFYILAWWRIRKIQIS